MLLLWDQFIWRSGSCRCHWVLLSTTKASVKLQSVKAHALFILLTGKEIFNRDRKTSVKCQTNWGYLSCCGSLRGLMHLPSSSDRSVRTAEPERTLWVYSIHQMNTMRCQSRSKYDIHSLSPPASRSSAYPPPLQSLCAAQRCPCMTHVSAALTCASVQKWECHLLAFQSLIPLSSICKIYLLLPCCHHKMAQMWSNHRGWLSSSHAGTKTSGPCMGLRLRVTSRIARVSIRLKGVKVSHYNVLTGGRKT